MEKLPKVFVNKIDKLIRNSQEEGIINNNNISLEDVFDNNKFTFNHKYLITLNNGKEYRTSLIANYGSRVLTIDNDLINIKDIRNIVEIKK